MKTTVPFHVDFKQYCTPSASHSAVLTTTEYTCGNQLLVYQQVGKNLAIRMKNRIDFELKREANLANESFFYKKTYHTDMAKMITKSTFLEKLAGFEKAQTSISQEILEEYMYKDETLKIRTVQIVITRKDDDAPYAIIDFANSDEYHAFVPPPWLHPYSE